MSAKRASKPLSPALRVAASTAAGLLAGVADAAVGPWWLAPLIAWDVASGLLLASTWLTLWSLSASQTAAHATRESPSRVNADALLISGSIVSLAAVGLVLVRASHETGLDKGLLVTMSIASIVLAWSVVHSVYTLRYASLYFQRKAGGVSFNNDEAPTYPDFAYLALTIGMTFQVSDTDLMSTAFRRLALRHAVLSYMFGALIIATTINLVAGLGQ